VDAGVLGGGGHREVDGEGEGDGNDLVHLGPGAVVPRQPAVGGAGQGDDLPVLALREPAQGCRQLGMGGEDRRRCRHRVAEQVEEVTVEHDDTGALQLVDRRRQLRRDAVGRRGGEAP
jgi:hypothetical protein